jgi:hypothetical protein
MASAVTAAIRSSAFSLLPSAFVIAIICEFWYHHSSVLPVFTIRSHRCSPLPS